MLIDRVWKRQPGDYFCLSAKSKTGAWTHKFFKRGQFKEVHSFIAANRDKDLYFCPHGLNKPQRTKEAAVPPHLLFADLDEVDPSKLDIMPTIAWETSPERFQALWYTNQPVTEKLNRRLTYALGADLGGWAFSKLLRIPGTRNYKYPGSVKVRGLWTDGPDFTLEEIRRKLPDQDEGQVTFGDAHEIYTKYEKNLSRYARRNLIKPKRVRIGARSQVIWRLGKECLEAGMSMDEAFTLLWLSPWNKFRERGAAGEAQLLREIEKSVEERWVERAVDVKEQEEEHEGPVFISMDQVERQNVTWLWYPFLARKEITIVEGDPGNGKSYMVQMISAAIADGKRLPSIKLHKAFQGMVAYFDIENNPNEVTKARLEDNRCRHPERFKQSTMFFSLDDEEALTRIYEALEQVRPDLVVFDPVTLYMGGADTHKAAEVNQALSWFKDIAVRFNCSIVLVRHLTKNTTSKALYRGQGSIAFAGTARIVLTCGPHPEEENVRVMKETKNNLAPIPDAIAYEIFGIKDKGGWTDRSRFRWGDFLDMKAEDILGPQKSKKNQKKKVVQFLHDFLTEGPSAHNAVLRAAEAKGISDTILQRVSKEIGVIKHMRGRGKKRKSYWSLPRRS